MIEETLSKLNRRTTRASSRNFRTRCRTVAGCSAMLLGTFLAQTGFAADRLLQDGDRITSRRPTGDAFVKLAVAGPIIEQRLHKQVKDAFVPVTHTITIEKAE